MTTVQGKHLSKKTAAKHNPLYNGNLPLDFDDQTASKALVLTDEQLANRFMAQWMSQIDPFSRYNRRLIGEDATPGKTVKMVKNMYRRYVINGDWQENKYAMVIDSILRSKEEMVPTVIDKHGIMYDEERLELQQIARRAQRRRRRI